MKYQRIFTANEGDPSVDNAGPDAIEQDLDNLYINSKELSDRADGLQSSVDNIVAGGTIPLDHSSAQTIYGLGTTAKHGHVKVIDALTSSEYADGEVLSARQGKVLYDGKAPSNHAKNDDTYGLGTETNYGHIALANNLSVANYQHGLALSANQGKVLNDKIESAIINSAIIVSNGIIFDGITVTPIGTYPKIIPLGKAPNKKIRLFFIESLSGEYANTYGEILINISTGMAMVHLGNKVRYLSTSTTPFFKFGESGSLYWGIKSMSISGSNLNITFNNDINNEYKVMFKYMIEVI